MDYTFKMNNLLFIFRCAQNCYVKLNENIQETRTQKHWKMFKERSRNVSIYFLKLVFAFVIHHMSWKKFFRYRFLKVCIFTHYLYIILFKLYCNANSITSLILKARIRTLILAEPGLLDDTYYLGIGRTTLNGSLRYEMMKYQKYSIPKAI